MISSTYLGAADFQTQLLNAMNPLISAGFVSRQDVINAYQSAITTIQKEAEVGARRGVNTEIPRIEKRVRDEAEKTVKPMVYGGLAVSGLAAILGIIAIAQARKARKGA